MHEKIANTLLMPYLLTNHQTVQSSILKLYQNNYKVCWPQKITTKTENLSPDGQAQYKLSDNFLWSRDNSVLVFRNVYSTSIKLLISNILQLCYYFVCKNANFTKSKRSADLIFWGQNDILQIFPYSDNEFVWINWYSNSFEQTGPN